MYYKLLLLVSPGHPIKLQLPHFGGARLLTRLLTGLPVEEFNEDDGLGLTFECVDVNKQGAARMAPRCNYYKTVNIGGGYERGWMDLSCFGSAASGASGSGVGAGAGGVADKGGGSSATMDVPMWPLLTIVAGAVFLRSTVNSIVVLRFVFSLQKR